MNNINIRAVQCFFGIHKVLNTLIGEERIMSSVMRHIIMNLLFLICTRTLSLNHLHSMWSWYLLMGYAANFDVHRPVHKQPSYKESALFVALERSAELLFF